MCFIHCLLHLVIVSPVRTNRNRPFHMVKLQHPVELVPVMPDFPWCIALPTVAPCVVKRMTGTAEEDQVVDVGIASVSVQARYLSSHRFPHPPQAKTHAASPLASPNH